VLGTILFAWVRFRSYKAEPQNKLSTILENKWYIDEFYQWLVVSPLKKLSAFFQTFIETKIIDGTVNGVGKLVNYSSRQMRTLQSGQVGAYVLLMVLGMLLLFVIQFFVS
jgi:NADH-quinone oxidoreductase subunit L